MAVTECKGCVRKLRKPTIAHKGLNLALFSTQTNGHRAIANFGPAYYATRSNILATATSQSLIAYRFLVGVKNGLFKGSLPDPLSLHEGLAPRDYIIHT